MKKTSLANARKHGKVDTFIKEHESDPDGDLDKLDALIRRPTQGSEKAIPKASTPAPSDG